MPAVVMALALAVIMKVAVGMQGSGSAGSGSWSGGDQWRGDWAAGSWSAGGDQWRGGGDQWRGGGRQWRDDDRGSTTGSTSSWHDVADPSQLDSLDRRPGVAPAGRAGGDGGDDHRLGVATAGRAGGDDDGGKATGKGKRGRTPPPADHPGHYASWPFPPCKKCESKENSWKNMWQETIVLESHTHKDDGKVDRRLSYFYCAACMSVEWACTMEAALVKIRTERPDYAKKAARAKGFKDAMENIQEVYPLLTTQKEKRNMTRNFFSVLFSDVLYCVLRKAQVLKKRQESEG